MFPEIRRFDCNLLCIYILASMTLSRLVNASFRRNDLANIYVARIFINCTHRLNSPLQQITSNFSNENELKNVHLFTRANPMMFSMLFSFFFISVNAVQTHVISGYRMILHRGLSLERKR